ncbi:MAG: hypothetical protein QXF82_00805 [Nitrososphaeria archaeon]
MKPAFMSEEDWKTVQSYAQKYGVSPELLASIGWYETHWGQLGWGRPSQGSYILGVGAYSENKANPLFRGLQAQLDWAAKHLSSFGITQQNITPEQLREFAKTVWKPGDPDSWSANVYRIYQNLVGSEQGKKKYPGRVYSNTAGGSPEIAKMSIAEKTLGFRWINFIFVLIGLVLIILGLLFLKQEVS